MTSIWKQLFFFYLNGDVVAKSMKPIRGPWYLSTLPSATLVYGPLPKRSKAMASGPTVPEGSWSFLNGNNGFITI